MFEMTQVKGRNVVTMAKVIEPLDEITDFAESKTNGQKFPKFSKIFEYFLPGSLQTSSSQYKLLPQKCTVQKSASNFFHYFEISRKL